MTTFEKRTKNWIKKTRNSRIDLCLQRYPIQTRHRNGTSFWLTIPPMTISKSDPISVRKIDGITCNDKSQRTKDACSTVLRTFRMIGHSNDGWRNLYGRSAKSTVAVDYLSVNSWYQKIFGIWSRKRFCVASVCMQSKLVSILVGELTWTIWTKNDQSKHGRPFSLWTTISCLCQVILGT